jgi:hypothetical protein
MSEMNFEWYKADLLPRMRPGGRIVLIMTRWHEDDLAGRILAEMAAGGEHWHVLSLPAEAEPDDPLGRQPGEWLWDDDYGYARFLAREKATQIPRNWSALYQQRPAPETGDYFREEWFHPYVYPPERSTLHVYGGSDYAVTADGGDYTVHAVVGVDPDNRMFLLDLWRGQTASDQWIEALRPRLQMETAILGRGTRADHLWDRALSPAARTRAQGLHRARAIRFAR